MAYLTMGLYCMLLCSIVTDNTFYFTPGYLTPYFGDPQATFVLPGAPYTIHGGHLCHMRPPQAPNTINGGPPGHICHSRGSLHII